MQKFIVSLVTIFSFFIASHSVSAATAEVTWKNPDKYRDVDPGDGSKKRFRERTFKGFEKHFNKLAEKLSADQTLKIEVTDVDLAGDTHTGGINRLRIVKELYYPKLTFSYQLLDADKSVIKSDDVKLKDMNFMTGGNLKYKHHSLGYEKKMLDKWFINTFQ